MFGDGRLGEPNFLANFIDLCDIDFSQDGNEVDVRGRASAALGSRFEQHQKIHSSLSASNYSIESLKFQCDKFRVTSLASVVFPTLFRPKITTTLQLLFMMTRNEYEIFYSFSGEPFESVSFSEGPGESKHFLMFKSFSFADISDKNSPPFK